MRKLVVLGLGVACAVLLMAASPHSALAWCHGGYLYDYACASPAYRFALSPWGYRSAYRGDEAAAWSRRPWAARAPGWSDRRVRWRRR